MRLNLFPVSEDHWVYRDLQQTLIRLSPDNIEITTSTDPLPGYDVYHCFCMNFSINKEWPQYIMDRLITTDHHLSERMLLRSLKHKLSTYQRIKYPTAINQKYCDRIKSATGTKCYRTPFGIDLDMFKDVKPQKHDKFVIGISGRYYPDGHKGEKCRRLIMQNFNEDVRYLFIGKRWGSEVQWAFEKGIDVDYIEREEHWYKGEKVQYKHYPDFYAMMDCLLITSREDGGNLGCLEALASGVPVVSTRCGYANELIDGWNGNLFDYILGSDFEGDHSYAIELLNDIRDGKYSDTYCRESVKSYDQKITYNRFYNLYRKVHGYNK